MKLNRVALEGNLCSDAQVIDTSTGKQLQKFTIGVNDDYKPSGSKEWIKRSYFVNCYCTTKVYDGLKKGVRVNIDGKLITKEYEKEGQKRTYTSVEVYQLSLVNTISKNVNTKVEEKEKEDNSKYVSNDVNVADDEDVPF